MEGSSGQRLAVGLLALLLPLTAAGQDLPELAAPAVSAGVTPEPGDLVFRRGSGLISEIARNFSKGERRFSHVGILAGTGPELLVVHAIEDRARNQHGVVTDRLDTFLATSQDWAVFRLRAPASVRTALSAAALEAAAAQMPYDNEFDLTTPERVYCTEFVWRLINGVTRSEVVQPSLVRGRAVVSISDIYASALIMPLVDGG